MDPSEFKKEPDMYDPMHPVFEYMHHRLRADGNAKFEFDEEDMSWIQYNVVFLDNKPNGLYYTTEQCIYICFGRHPFRYSATLYQTTWRNGIILTDDGTWTQTFNTLDEWITWLEEDVLSSDEWAPYVRPMEQVPLPAP